MTAAAATSLPTLAMDPTVLNGGLVRARCRPDARPGLLRHRHRRMPRGGGVGMCARASLRHEEATSDHSRNDAPLPQESLAEGTH